MVLAHRHRQIGRPAPVEVTKPAVAIAVRVTLDIFVPEDLKRHMLALQLPMHMGPVRLDAAAVTRLRSVRLVERGLQNRIGDLVAQRPGKPRGLRPPQRLAHRRGCSAHTIRDRLVAKALFKSIAQYLADTPHGHSLRRHLVPSLGQAKGRNISPAEHPDQTPPPGGGIISESGGG